MPAPEPLDVDPIEDLAPAKRASEDAGQDKSSRGVTHAKGHFDDTPEKPMHSPTPSQPARQGQGQDHGEHGAAAEFEEEDDSLFGPATRIQNESIEPATINSDSDQGDDDRRDDRRGFRGFNFAARRFGGNAGQRDQDDPTDIDDDAPPFIKHQSRKEREVEPSPAAEEVVDADWEDVDMAAEKAKAAAPEPPEAEETPKPEAASGDRRQGFGRRASDHVRSDSGDSEERRASGSEIARLADVSPFDPEEFDEEFFTSLKVTPKAMAQALKKTRRRAESRRKNRLTPFRALGWAVWLAAVVGASYAVVAYRDDIVKIAPKTADAYAIIGIEADPYGLAIENVEHRLAMSTAGPTIEISGKLHNKGDEPVDAPLLQAEALGPRGELLSRWTFSPNDEEVLEGATIEFITRAPAPEGVAEVALSFAPARSPVSDLLPGSE